MTPLRVGALVSVLVALACWCVARALQRVPRSLAAARAQMFGPSHATGEVGPIVRHHIDLPSGLAGRIERLFGGSLHVIDQTPADVVTRIVVAAAAVGLSVLAGVVALLAVGVLPVSAVWLVAPVVSAAAAGWTMVLDTRSRIARHQRELRQAANDFVQLVAVGLTTDQSVEEAIRFALDVGGGPSFELLRRSVLAAPQRGVPVWEALDAIGARYDVRELSEFATSVERQGLQGVSIGSTVATMAESMRAKALDQLERDADRANANLAGPTIGFVVTTIVFLAYPLALRISEAFGG